eukprot:jgi/Astpho2/4830/e_gw1.00068.1.1_t
MLVRQASRQATASQAATWDDPTPPACSIYEAIGRGKHSVVYKGRKKKTIQYYAIKSVDKSQKARVLQEVRTMHALDHENVLKFYAWYETSNHLWLILEYCVGGDLMSLLRQDMRLPEASIHDLARDLVISIQYLHASSVIYCDLKPSNILLDENGRIKLGGFGLSRRLSDINKTPLQQLPSAKHGTPCYMAPELFQDGSTHSTASDLWALGCVLYECAAGRPPFVSSSLTHLVNDILATEPAPLPEGASEHFIHLIQRLLEKNPAVRASWKELCSHPFWNTALPERDLPAEPMLQCKSSIRNLPAPAASDAGRSEAPPEPPDRTSTSGLAGPSAASLIWHATDSSVKPIVSNRRIERLPEPQWDPRLLPFKPLALPEMLKCSQQDLEAFLTQIYRAIAGAAPLKDKTNVLAYFETLCVDTGAANVLINSSLTILIVRMLRNARMPALRVRLASVLGLLVRHATYIADELVTTGVFEVLAEALRDKSVHVRRRSMASLGELLFYVATQQQVCHWQPGGMVGSDPNVSSAWHVPSAILAQVQRLLKPGEDEIAQHYAVKTLENIASQGGDWAARLASAEAAACLVAIWQGSRADNLRATAASTLSRMLRHEPALLSLALDKYRSSLLVGVLTLRCKIPFWLAQEEKEVAAAVVGLLEGGLPALRAKALLAGALMARTNARAFLLACKSKLLVQAERLERDGDAYVTRCMAAFQHEVAAMLPGFLQQVNAKPAGSLLACLELVCQYSQLAEAARQAVVVHLAPAMAGAVARRSEQQDAGFLCLKLLCDLVTYAASRLDGQVGHFASGCLDGGVSGPTMEALAGTLQEGVLPLVPSLLHDDGPMALHAIKLLGALLGADLPRWMPQFQRLGLIPEFFKFLSLEHPNNNVHNIRMCHHVISSSALTQQQLREVEAVAKVHNVLVYSYENVVEPFLQPVLELCGALLARDAADLQRQVAGAGQCVALLPSLPIFLELAAHPEAPVALAAAQCLAASAEAFPKESAGALLAPQLQVSGCAPVVGGS